MNSYPSYKPSGIDWIGEIPGHWNIRKFNRVSYMKGRIGWQGLKHSEFTMNSRDPYLITGMNFRDGIIRWEEVYHISEERYNEAPEIQLKKFDVLMTKDGTIGKLLFVNSLPGKASLNSHLLVLRPKNGDYIPKYLYYQLQSLPFSHFIELNKTGTTFYGLSQEAMGEYRIILPDKDEQTAIANFLDEKTAQIDKLIANKQKLIELLKEERTAIINEAVSGEEKNWEKRRLSTLGKFFKGRGIKKDETKEEGLPCIRYGELYTRYDRIVYDTVSFINEETSKSSEMIKKGDILFAGSGETVEDIGKAIVYFGDADAYAGGDVIVLRLQRSLEPTYASYLLNASFVQHQKALAGKGEIIVHIYPKNIREIIVPLPTKEEQLEIVNYLDRQTGEIDLAIPKIEREIELMQEYRTALISEVVTGKMKVV